QSSVPIDRTVVDAATVGMAPPLTHQSPVDSGPRPPVPALPGAPGGGGKRLLFGTLAALALLSAGIAAASYLGLTRQRSLKADDRGLAAPSLPPAKAGGQGPTHAGEAQPGLGAAARPTRVPRVVRSSVPAGTEVRVTLDASLGSSSSHAGETFTARTASPVVAGARVAIPAGSR